MASIVYKITIKGKKGIVLAKYKSPEKLEEGEEILLFYAGENHLVKITAVKKGLRPTAEGEEV